MGIRLLLLVLVWLFVTTPLVIVTHIALPLLTATVIAGKDGRTFIKEDSGRFVTAIRWYLSLLSYIVLLLERFPIDEQEQPVIYVVTPRGEPSIASALLRIIVSIPSALALALLGIAGAVVWVFAVISVLMRENYADGLYNYQLGVMRWHARLLAYHASLVDEYPPFSFAAGPELTPGERMSGASDD